ncbi:MAG: hypothetical protein R3330_14745, partial [Saprospiraceae bacterium]|nr:hypothetical protein [Saprospiraceae bacterium]
TVTVDIPGAAQANNSDLVTITATSQGDSAKSDGATLTTTVQPVYGVDLSPNDAVSGLPGETVTYTLHITNTGDVADTFDLVVTGNRWATTLSASLVALEPDATAVLSVTVDIPPNALGNEGDTAIIVATSQSDINASDSAVLAAGRTRTAIQSSPSITLEPGASGMLIVTVDIPAGTLGDEVDIVSLTAVSQRNPAASDSATLTTSVDPVYGAALSPDDALSGGAGQTVTYTLHVTNTGNISDTFDLAAAGHTWTTTLSSPTIFLGPGSPGLFTVSVQIPGSAVGNESDLVTITATSQADISKSDNTTLTTTVDPVSGVKLSPDAALSGPAGKMVTYTLYITNTGNVVDTFTLSATGNVWTTTLSTSDIMLGSGVKATFSAVVHLPSGALGTDSDSATVAATSHTNNNQQDTTMLTTTVLPVYGVNLSPDDALSGLDGKTVTYTLHI